MAPTAPTKTKPKTKTKTPADSTQTPKKKSRENLQSPSSKLAPTESTKRKKDDNEPVGKAKRAKVVIDEPQKKDKKGETTKPAPKLISANANAKLKPKPIPSPSKPFKTKQKPKKPSPSPVPSESNEEGEDEEDDNGSAAEDVSENDNDEEVHLHGFSTDEDDSSDEDEGTGGEKPGLSAFEISKLPTVAKDDESVKRRLEKAKRQPTEDRGVVYIGRLPHGFYEDQLRGYFSQFGDITRLRVSRNKKTGQCKHYGFIEFDSSSVAQIVTETMDNYLLLGHILKCKLIPKDEVHPELWIGANRKWRVVPRDRIFRVQHNKERTEEQQTKAYQRLIKRQNARKRNLEALGIQYDFDAVGYKKTEAVEK